MKLFIAFFITFLSFCSHADLIVPSDSYPFKSVGAPGFVSDLSAIGSLGIEPTSYGTFEGSVIDDPRCSANGACATATSHRGYFQSGVLSVRFGEADYPWDIPSSGSTCTLFAVNAVLYDDGYTNEPSWSIAVSSPKDALVLNPPNTWATVNKSIAFVSDGITVPGPCFDLQKSNETYNIPFNGNNFFLAVGHTNTSKKYYYSRDYGSSNVLWALMPGRGLLLQTNVIACSGSSWGARGNCAMSRRATYNVIGNGGVIPSEPPVCEVVGDLMIDLGLVSKKTATGKQSSTTLSLSCTKSASANLKFIDPELSKEGLSINIGFGEKFEQSLVTRVGKTPVNVTVFARIKDIIANTRVGEYTFSTPLVILYD